LAFSSSLYQQSYTIWSTNDEPTRLFLDALDLSFHRFKVSHQLCPFALIGPGEDLPRDSFSLILVNEVPDPVVVPHGPDCSLDTLLEFVVLEMLLLELFPGPSGSSGRAKTHHFGTESGCHDRLKIGKFEYSKIGLNFNPEFQEDLDYMLIGSYYKYPLRNIFYYIIFNYKSAPLKTIVHAE
jgi:hypothetical protein